MSFLTSLSTLGVVIFAAIISLCSWNASVLMDVFSYHRRTSSLEYIVANSWKKNIETPQVSFQNIAVGVNGNVDLITKGTALLIKLDPNSNSSKEEHVDHSSLKSIKDLKETFGFFHEKGAGGERHMEKYEDFQHVLKVATSIPTSEYFIGGNAALMAEKFASLKPDKSKVMIGCPVGPVLKPLLNPRMQVLQSSSNTDEYHLILEYSKQERWDGRVAPIASRFIFSHDVSNSKMLVMEEFITSLKNFNPDLVVLSGFHLLEANEKAFWLKRITEVSELLKPLSKNVPIHLELASMANKDCVKEIMEKIFPLVDSIGLNEQELWMVCQIGGGPHCAQHQLHGPPPIPQAADVSAWMLKTFSSVANSRVTRVHFHTLPFHIVLTVDGSLWSNQATSVLAGTRIASNQACDDDAYVRPDKVELRIPSRVKLSALHGNDSMNPEAQFQPEKPVITWKNNDIWLHLSPVLVCRKPVKTVGLGDAISATGLIYSSFSL